MSNDAFDAELLKKRAVFPVFTQENVRQRDLDSQGHVNNAVYVTYFEIGRGAARREATRDGAGRPPEATGVVARQVINYHRPVLYPASLDIGTGIIRIGRSSYVYGVAVFQGELCMATGEVTQVLIERATGRSMPIPDGYRRSLETILLLKP